MEYAGSGVVTRQGQITVPKKIRKATGINKGTVLEFYFNNRMIIVKPKLSPPEVFEELSGRTRERFIKENITKKDVEEEIRAVRKNG